MSLGPTFPYMIAVTSFPTWVTTWRDFLRDFSDLHSAQYAVFRSP